MTRVVHVNSPEFRDNPDAVYIGRAVHRAKDNRCHLGSIWSNPFSIAECGGRVEAIAAFENFIRAYLRVSGENATSANLMLLDGKVLGCWCHPKACHGDAIVKLIEELKKGPQ